MKPIFAAVFALCLVGAAHAQMNIPRMFSPFEFSTLMLQKQQLDLAESEARRAAQEDRNRQAPVAPPPPKHSEQVDPAMREWLKAAAPRLHLFPDFDKVVYANNVSITIDMIRLMAGSPYAADIAYYLATHKTESLAVSQMPLLEAARAVSAIEARVKK